MRTIDSDDFLKQSTELYEHAGWDEREVHFSLADLRCNLEMMPTVDAIPVEWIKKRMLNVEDAMLGVAYSVLISEWEDEQAKRKEE